MRPPAMEGARRRRRRSVVVDDAVAMEAKVVVATPGVPKGRDQITPDRPRSPVDQDFRSRRRLIARMVSGVVPQHPPTSTAPTDDQSAASAA